MDPSLSLARVAENLPFTFTGADLYALCSDAMLKAVTRSARLLDQKLAVINTERSLRSQTKASVAYYFDHHATDEDLRVSVIEDDFMKARSELVPSVSVDELQHYQKVRDTFEGAAKTKNEQSAIARHSSVTQAPQTDKDPTRTRPQTGKGSATNGTSRPLNGSKDTNSDADDDDYVIKTDKLTLNGPGGRPPINKGKGKGKSRSDLMADSSHEPENGDDLYD